MNFYFDEVLVKDLKVDPSYQRDIKPYWVKQISSNYDPAQVRQLILSRRADGSLYIIDGNHTAKATLAAIGENAKLQAKIYLDLTPIEEARMFEKLNTNSKKVRYSEKLKARVACNEEKAINYISALNKSGIDWLYHAGGKDGPFEAHKDGEYLFFVYGEESFIEAMRILHATGNHDIYKGFTVGGICYICKYVSFDRNRLIKVLSNASSKTLRAQVTLYGTTIHNTGTVRDRACAKSIIETYYNKNLRAGNKIDLPQV